MLTSENIKTGKHISPLLRLRIMSADEWEEFIEEWVDSLQEHYYKVEKLGGAGDKGRDVIAIVDSSGVWDNYQCKHYGHPLRPSDIWTEIGKLVYYTSKGEFSCPRRYLFVAPQGVGTTLSDYLRSPEKLVQGLRDNWDKHCKTKITTTDIIELSTVDKQINKIDFSIFEYVKPSTIIDQHRKTSHFIPRFGGGLPKRAVPPEPPTQPTPEESIYLKKILKAYSDYSNQHILSIDDLRDNDLIEHYKDSRKEFYSAEALKRFSRDALSDGEFQTLQQEFLDGIKDEIRNPSHANGYIRLLQVIKVARALQITSHALIDCLITKDRGGICHQLANENKSVTWVKHG